MEKSNQFKPFGIKDQMGYLCGSLGNDFMFMFSNMFLMVFYTSALRISPTTVGTCFLLVRIIDGFTDVLIGRVVDKSKTGKNGKFRPWIRNMAGPVAIASFLMYQSSLADASMTVKIVYMYITYILWGSVCYTCVNIPYSSMMSVMTDDAKERSTLSIFRTLGSNAANLIVAVIGPAMLYGMDAQGNSTVINSKFPLAAAIISILSIIFYALFYFLTVERIKEVKEEKVETKPQSEKSFAKTIKEVLSNKALLGLMGSALVGIMFAQLLTTSLQNYLFLDYFKDARYVTLMSFVNILVSVLLAPFIPNLSIKLGKKEMSIGGLVIAAIIYIVLFLLKVSSPIVFVVMYLLISLALGFFNLVSFAMIVDCIDYNQIKNGERNDGIVYAVYSFARKLGLALAGGLTGWILGWIGYDINLPAGSQAESVNSAIYNVFVLTPAICFIIAALFLIFVYPLGRNKVKENTETLRKLREKLENV